MDLIANLSLGFTTAVSPMNLLYCLIGALAGTLVGVLPGISPLNTIAMLLPFTFGMPPTSALIMLAGIFYGAQYGGSTSAILINVPGETSAVVTCLDGYQLARQGKAGKALGIAALASFFAGCVATIVIAVISQPLATFAMKFNSPEYFSLMILGLIAAVTLSAGSPIKAITMVVIGVLAGLVGIDVNSGAARLTFGRMELAEGMDFVPVVVGLFGIGEVVANLEVGQDRNILKGKIKGLLPDWAEIKYAFPAILRGTALGTMLGILPGGGAALSSFAAYAAEKKASKHPETFGKGEIRGVAAPEAANNAGAQTSFIPMLTMGIPTNALMALMIGAMMIHGIQPGPMVITKQPELYWGIVVSMWVGNLMLLIINLPLVRVWVALLKVPYRLLFPAIIMFCCVGAFASMNSTFSVWLMLGWGIAGYFFKKIGIQPAPMILGFVLGPMLEENFRRTMNISNGNPAVFIQRPISAVLLAISVTFILLLALPSLRKKREILNEDE
ncbi:MAG: tripartite tricarboxylate transporter permease [Treponemataceae bacterium]